MNDAIRNPAMELFAEAIEEKVMALAGECSDSFNRAFIVSKRTGSTGSILTLASMLRFSVMDAELYMHTRVVEQELKEKQIDGRIYVGFVTYEDDGGETPLLVMSMPVSVELVASQSTKVIDAYIDRTGKTNIGWSVIAPRSVPPEFLHSQVAKDSTAHLH